MLHIKSQLRRYTPDRVLRVIRTFRYARYRNLDPAEAFTKIYREGAWGRSIGTAAPYRSGGGSHSPEIVAAYVNAVRAWTEHLPEMLSAADLGCGDFNVGSQVRPFFSDYAACDVVSDLVESNAKRFAELGVDFRIIDLTRDEPPQADVAIIRQVFQHLSNAQILQALRRIDGRYKFLLVSEHVPVGDFRPNVDKAIGPGIRLDMGSGIELAAPPFGVTARASEVLCEVPQYGGVIRTTLYDMTETTGR